MGGGHWVASSNVHTPDSLADVQCSGCAAAGADAGPFPPHWTGYTHQVPVIQESSQAGTRYSPSTGHRAAPLDLHPAPGVGVGVEASPLSWRNGPGQRTQSLADGDALRLIQPEKRAPQSGPARLQQAAAAPAASPGRHLCGSVRSAMSATEGWGDRAPRALLESASVLTHLEVVVSS